MIDTKLSCLLLHLPVNIYDVHDHDSLHQPYGLACISSFLKAKGYEVSLLDAAAELMDRESILEYVKELEPDVIGLTVYTAWLPHTVEFLEDVKKFLPNVKTVLGGPHPSSEENINVLKQNPSVDYVVQGEGEYPLWLLMQHLETGEIPVTEIKGLTYREGDEVKANCKEAYIKNLDDMPMPDWESLPMDRYWGVSSEKQNFANLVFSRGCVYACSFCGQHVSLGKKVRFMSAKRVMKEIKYLYYRHGVRELNLSDATFNIDNDWVSEICHELIKFDKKDFVWGCNVRANDCEEDVLRLMRKAGCTNVFMGVESGDDRMLKEMHKGTTVAMIKKAVDMLRRCDIKVYCGFIFGMPGETVESIQNTMKFAKELRHCHTAFSLASPFPGTTFYKRARLEGYHVDNWAKCDYFGISYVPKDMTKEQLNTLYKKALTRQYLSPVFIYHQLTQFSSWLQFKVTFRLGMRILFGRKKKSERGTEFEKARANNRVGKFLPLARANVAK